MTPLDVAILAAVGAFWAAVGLIVATYWYGLQEFRRRAIWSEDPTRLGRTRTTLTAGTRYSIDSMNWQQARRILPKVAVAGGIVTAGVVLLGVGFNEVFLS